MPRRQAPALHALRHARLAFALALLAASGSAMAAGNEVYVGTLQKEILVIDEDTETIVARIPMQTDALPFGMTLSYDKKRVIVTTLKNSAFEIIDVATRKSINAFSIDDPIHSYRVRGYAPDPSGKLLYAIFSLVTFKPDRFILEKPQFGIIDLEKGAITKTFPYPEDLGRPTWGTELRVSPDGKLLYMFKNEVKIFDTGDFHLVDTIPLSKPTDLARARIRLTVQENPFEDRGTVTGIFTSIDPIVHRKVFGLATFDLNSRRFEFSPVGPAATPSSPVDMLSTEGMTALQITPDGKMGYAIQFIGGVGNRRTEFWIFDMASRKVVKRIEIDGPVNFHFTLSGDGKKIYLHGTVSTLEVRDASTLEHRSSIDLGSDRTAGPLVVPALGDTPASAGS